MCVRVCVRACARQSGGGAAKLLLTSVHLNYHQGTLPMAQPDAGSLVNTSDRQDYSETDVRG